MKAIIRHIINYSNRLLLLAVLLFLEAPVHAQQQATSVAVDKSQSPIVTIMIVIMMILLLAIVLLSHVLRGAMDIYRDKMVKERSGTAGSLPLLVLLMLTSSSVFANDPVTAAESVTSTFDMGGLSPLAFYLMWTVIALELLVLIVMLFQVRILLGIGSAKKRTEEAPVAKKRLSAIWQKLNSFRPVAQESDIELSHSYDGIRELDNRLPPWWLYGFYVTIIFSVIYLWRFHVSHTAPNQEEEYIAAMKIADEQKEAFLKKAANQVDERTVKFLDSENDLHAGKALFEVNCTACHGKMGEGVVGPNLTDNYWLHGGSINDVFKSIKYGIPEKGMRNWNEDFSPVQIAQLASFIKSMSGSNPPNAKEKQGELYEETKSISGEDSKSKVLAAN
jgi:cytochrome c oxidase cbb3-type subunit III